MAQMNMIEAIRSAHDVMMDKDPSVVVLGEDVGYFGGVFRCTDGLQRKYGEHRVIDAPIAEGGIVATAIGMGVNGLRPVAEIQFADYIYPGFDQIVSELARLRYRSCGEFFSPVTIRTPSGGGIRGGQTHSQSPEALFAHVSGIKTVMPSDRDAVESIRRKGASYQCHRVRRPCRLFRAQAYLQRTLRRRP
jgi:2-oxoisovalerate dehydrogenase E1 component beta subunit